MPWKTSHDLDERLKSRDPETKLLARIEAKRLLLENARGKAPKPGGGFHRKESYRTIVEYERELEDLETELKLLRLKNED